MVNAIWNRINNAKLVPVTQQFIKDKGGNHYYIDLYFPQLKIGVECDEGYHNSIEQKVLDAERELTIFDVLKQIDGRDYIALHVDVTKPYNEVEAQINAHVSTIKSKIDELKRVVFSQVKDSTTGVIGYRFVGFFVGDHYDENGRITYRRIDDKFKIIKKIF